MRQSFAAANRPAVDVPRLDVARHAGVRDIQLLVVGRKANAVRFANLVGHLINLCRLRVDAIDRFLGFLLALVALVIPADAVDRIGEPDPAVGMHGDVVR